MTHTIQFATPPMLARRLRRDIEAAFPDHCLAPPSTHMEMYETARDLGTAEARDSCLTISAYPQLLQQVITHPSIAADVSALGLPPLRQEWQDLGLTPPTPRICLLAVVPLVLAVDRDRFPALQDWDDLYPLLNTPGVLAAPPLDTPLPFLVAQFLASRWECDDGALLTAMDCASPPLDINKRLSTGDVGVGILPPVFCRNFRGGNVELVWPRSGALAVPVMAVLSAEAPPTTSDVLHFLTQPTAQATFADLGGMAPVTADVAGFTELVTADWRMIWVGWNTLCAAGNAMAEHLATSAHP